MRIVIFVDSRYRDTLGCLLVKKQLKKLRKEWNIFIVSIDLWQQTMQLLRPHVVVLNHAIGFRNKEIIRQAEYSIILPTEGRPNTDNQETWFVQEQDGGADLYLSWNERIAKRFEKTKAVVTGCPRFDIYHTHTHLIDSQQKARAKYGLDPHKETIGIFTSFSQAKFAFQDTQFNAHDWKDLGIDKIHNRTNPLAFAQNELAERRKFMNAIAAFADVHPNYQYLIKPHPMEDILELQEWCDKNGFVCITQDAIYNVISACDIVINRAGCVTSLDSWLSKKRVLSIGTPEGKGIAYDTNVSNAAYNIADLLDKYAELDEQDQFNPAQEYIERCGLGSPSSARTARAIVDNLDERTFTDYEIPIKNLIDFNVIITEHTWQRGALDISRGAVGKAATMSYINGMEEGL